MSSKTPLANNWVYKGEMLPNPGRLGYPYGNNHSHMQAFGSKYYMLYHTQWLEHQDGYDGGYRNLQANSIEVRVVRNTPYIQALSSETATVKGVSQLTGIRINPYEEQQAEMINNGAGITIEETDIHGNTVVNMTNGSWTSVYGLSFSPGGEKAKAVSIAASGSGVIEVRNSIDGEPIATISVSGETVQEYVEALAEELSGIVNNIYFVCTSGNVKVDSWRFNDETTGIKEVKGDPTPTLPREGVSPWGDLEGVVKGQILNGKYIEDGKVIIIRNGKKYNSAGAILH
jgi:arabinoxylan arabinofuranohydrolase